MSGRGSAFVAGAVASVLVLLAAAVVIATTVDGPGGGAEFPDPASSASASTRAAGSASGSCSYVPAGSLTRSDAAAAESATPTFGVLGSRAVDLDDLSSRGVTSVVLEVAWDRFEPTRGCYDRTYVAQVLARAAEIADAGLVPVLDAGLQYPPGWVLDLPGARFVNQYGTQWHGSIGEDVPDAVFNVDVRRAQATYLRSLGYLLRSVRLAAIRVGGLANNELSYPVPDSGDDVNSFWAFSRNALRVSPVDDYRPGSGERRSTATFLDWYTSSLTSYGLWLAAEYRDYFGQGPVLEMLLPSWGVRPGDRDAAVATGLGGESRGERTGALNQGLDWAHLAARLSALEGRTELYSTWLDAEDQGSDSVYMSPVRYLAALGTTYGLRVGGENTGNDSLADMQRSFERVRSLGLSTLFWFNAAQLLTGGFATLDDLGAQIAGEGPTSS